MPLLFITLTHMTTWAYKVYNFFSYEIIIYVLLKISPNILLAKKWQCSLWQKLRFFVKYSPVNQRKPSVDVLK